MSATSEDKWISEYLRSNPAFASATLLEGGVSNFVFRITKTDGSTVILKHAEAYAAFDKNWVYSIDRVECEHMALLSIPAALQSTPSADLGEVEMPRVISYDSSGNNLIINDFGSTSKDLHTAFPFLTSEQRMDYGRRLGSWLAALHQSTAIDKAAFSKNVKARDRKGIDQRISLLSAGLPIASSGVGNPDQIASEKGEFLELLEDFVVAVTEADSGNVVHGDFWPGNILTDPSSATPEAKDLLAVIDWEDVRLGTGASDAGVFAAEAWLLCYFHSSSPKATVAEVTDFGMFRSFLDSYLKGKGSVDESFTKEAILQFAINLSVGRGGPVLMLPVKRLGIQIIRLMMGESRDWKALAAMGMGIEAWGPWVQGIYSEAK